MKKMTINRKHQKPDRSDDGYEYVTYCIGTPTDPKTKAELDASLARSMRRVFRVDANGLIEEPGRAVHGLRAIAPGRGVFGLGGT